MSFLKHLNPVILSRFFFIDERMTGLHVDLCMNVYVHYTYYDAPYEFFIGA